MSSKTYVPAMRWRQGEYQALLRLGKDVKDFVVPFITIPEVEFDFEERRPKKTVQEHVHPFAQRFKSKWGKRPAFIAVDGAIVGQPMADGRDVFTYVFEALRSFTASAIPAIPLVAGTATVRSIAAIARIDRNGVAVSLKIEDLMKPGPRARIDVLAGKLGVSIDEVDLIVDLSSPNYEPYSAFAAALTAALKRLGNLNDFRNFIVVGTAIPASFRGIARGEDEIARHDWIFYKEFVAKLPKTIRRPNFGDYTIVHPSFTPVDMRVVKAAGKIVYATLTSWEVRKGGAFRDDPEQMHSHCASIVASGQFLGDAYSNGDAYIGGCARRELGPSNLSKWKEVAINHHITLVTNELAKIAA